MTKGCFCSLFASKGILPATPRSAIGVLPASWFFAPGQPLRRPGRAVLRARPAVQAVGGLDAVRRAGLYALLGAVGQAGAAANTIFRNSISSVDISPCISKDIILSENGFHAQVEILDFSPVDFEYNANVPGIAGVDVGKIWLFSEDNIYPLFLFILRRGDSFRGEPYHLLELGVAQNLHPTIRKQLPAEVLAPGGEEVHPVRLIVYGADVA